jgi:hypothetical protein
VTFNPLHFYNYLKENTLIGIKGGKTRESFLNIWMVEVNRRVFARSWSKSERSWFTEFLNSKEGQIKVGEKVINVTGKKLTNEPELMESINKAYLKKYNQTENLFYAKGITKPEYEEYTMEFFYLESK